MDFKKLAKKLIKNFPKVPEVKTLISYVVKYPNAKREEVISYWYKISYGIDPYIINEVKRITENFYFYIPYVDVFTKDLMKFAKVEGKNNYFFRFLVDVKNNKIHILPPKPEREKNKKQAFAEHVDAAVSILGLKSREDIIKNPEIAKHLVDCYVSIENGKIKKMFIHYKLCSLVTLANVKYEPKDIDRAYSIMLNLIYSGNIEIARDLEIRKAV